MSVNTPLRELILTNVGRVNGIMQTIVEDLDALAAENDRLREENAELRAGPRVKDGAIPVTAEAIRQSEPGSMWEDGDGEVWGWDGEALRFWFHEPGDPKRPETVLDRYGPLARFTVAPRGDHDGVAETPFGELDETDLRAWIEWVKEEVHRLASTTPPGDHGIRAQLEEERRIIEATTEGTWEVHVERYGSDAGDYHGAHIPGVADQLITEHDGSYPPLSPEDAEFIAHARTALPARNAQVEAVLALHAPADFGECNECSNGTPYPCPTVRAIEEELDRHARH